MTDEIKHLETIAFFLRPYKLDLVFLFILGLVMAAFDIINIALLYPILAISTDQTYYPDNIVFNSILVLENFVSAALNIQDELITSCILFMGFALVSFLFGVLYIRQSLKITTKITVENKTRIFRKQNNSDYQYFLDHKQGDLIYITTRAPSFIAEVFTNLAKLSIDIILSISTVLLLLSISIGGSVILLCAGLGYYALTRYLSLKVSYNTGTGRYQASQQENVILNEYYNGVKQIRVYGVADRWVREYVQIVERFWTLWRKDNFWLQIPSTLLYLLIYLGIGSVVIIIRVFYPYDFINYIPILGTFSLAVLKMLPRLANFGNYQMGIMSALPNLGIIKEFIDDKGYSQIQNGKNPVQMHSPTIVFDHVTFSYPNRDPLFEDLSLRIDAGKTTALVGISGSGKSTIIDLILRMYDIGTGEVLINTVNVRDYDIGTLHEKVGYVGQDTFIYNASIRDNIAFGREYSLNEIMDAARLANLHDFIMQLPRQYDTVVGDRGVKISGGERQRIAIARAIIRNPELLILDEATSSLDNVSEKIVQDAINKVIRKCTTIMVAHRLSTVKDADIIYVLEKGRVVEQGTHDQLIEKRGKYWELYTAQGLT